MDYLSLTYLVLMTLGVLWVAYRIVHYLHSQREREFGSMGSMSEEEFRTYLESLKRQTPESRTEPSGEKKRTDGRQ